MLRRYPTVGLFNRKFHTPLSTRGQGDIVWVNRNSNTVKIMAVELLRIMELGALRGGILGKGSDGCVSMREGEKARTPYRRLKFRIRRSATQHSSRIELPLSALLGGKETRTSVRAALRDAPCPQTQLHGDGEKHRERHNTRHSGGK